MHDFTTTTPAARTEPFWMGACLGALAMLLTVLAYERLTRQPDPSAVDMPTDVIKAYNMGVKDALRTNPPSLDLESVCVELWANRR